VSDDIHSPTTAAPTPEPATTVAVPAGTTARPDEAGDGGTELPFGIPPDKPEILVGAAFAGGVLAAVILKRLGGG
jgi:hypothetical protein